MAVFVCVFAGNGEKGIRDLKKKSQQEALFRVLKGKRFYEAPSVKRVRKKQETVRRKRKLFRKQMMEE